MSEDGEVSYTPPWKNAAQELFSGKFGFGDMVTHEQINSAMSMPEPTGTAEEYKAWVLARMPQFDALAQWLLETHNMCLASVHGQGYRIVHPHEQTEYAQDTGMKLVRRELVKMARRLYYVDRSKLTHEQARDNADAMARAAFLKQQIGKAERLRFSPLAIDG